MHVGHKRGRQVAQGRTSVLPGKGSEGKGGRGARWRDVDKIDGVGTWGGPPAGI
jgi:hypothetical protein